MLSTTSKGRTRASTIGAHVPRRTSPSPTNTQEPNLLTGVNLTHVTGELYLHTKGSALDDCSHPPPPPKRSLKFCPASGRSSPPKRKPTRTRSSINEFGTFILPKLPFTPADAAPPPAYTPRPTEVAFLAHKSSSTSLLYSQPSPPVATKPMHESESDDDRDDDEMIYTTWAGSRGPPPRSSSSLRARIFGSVSAHVPPRARDRAKTICTTPGQLCAGETETEIDEPPRHLPTSRIIPSSGPLVPPNTLQQRLTPLLFEFSRLLSIVPAIFGTLYNLYQIYDPPTAHPTPGKAPPQRVDFAISAIWASSSSPNRILMLTRSNLQAILTGFQCLYMTTGLLTRWRLYYPPLPTLIRLLALQGICWPATQLTCSILEHKKRPVIVWAVIGTTTCISRSVQIWVTSNLWWETRDTGDGGTNHSASQVNLSRLAAGAAKDERPGYWKRWGGGKWGGRRWDWKEVGVKCVLPAGIVYCIMAWAEQLRREFSGC
ncbi:hypothetical protein BDZ94DRAFT_1305175 [Collybia nuda]|uniref:Uncharacterized protein n=1 Tax=Collybia nuda TaxID=64659 RepID=A0A9P5YER2_9AGAR|nr:hypothetical protein BDZ94DRAFT_1305175 [Collybia nuda]